MVVGAQGRCESRFERVREEFERNFSERGELGASLCVTVDGETVVDLWGGVADPATGRTWERDTVGVLFLARKGSRPLVSTCWSIAGNSTSTLPWHVIGRS